MPRPPKNRPASCCRNPMCRSSGVEVPSHDERTPPHFGRRDHRRVQRCSLGTQSPSWVSGRGKPCGLVVSPPREECRRARASARDASCLLIATPTPLPSGSEQSARHDEGCLETGLHVLRGSSATSLSGLLPRRPRLLERSGRDRRAAEAAPAGGRGISWGR